MEEFKIRSRIIIKLFDEHTYVCVHRILRMRLPHTQVRYYVPVSKRLRSQEQDMKLTQITLEINWIYLV